MKNNKMIFAVIGTAIAVVIILVIFLLIVPTQCSKQESTTTETETTLAKETQQETVSRESKEETAATTAKEATTGITAATTAKETTATTATETTAAPKTAPTIKLEIYEGPTYSPADNVCYYRIKAIVTGNPYPEIAFSKDDSGGAWGADRVQINIHAGESYNLVAVAKSSGFVAYDSILLNWGCSETPGTTEGSIVGTSESYELASLNIILHPSNIGYIVHPTGINTDSAIIGDSISNEPVRGYFAFNLSGIAGKNIQSVKLEVKTYRILDDPLPAFLGRIEIHMIENYLPLGPEDWLPPATDTFAAAFYHDDEPLYNSLDADRLKNAIQQRVDAGQNVYFYIFYYNPESSDGDFRGDGREFTKDTITLQIKYTD